MKEKFSYKGVLVVLLCLATLSFYVFILRQARIAAYRHHQEIK